MNKKMIFTLLLMTFRASGVSAFSGPAINEGLWQITTVMEMPVNPGMPNMGSTQNTQRELQTERVKIIEST